LRAAPLDAQRAGGPDRSTVERDVAGQRGGSAQACLRARAGRPSGADHRSARRGFRFRSRRVPAGSDDAGTAAERGWTRPVSHAATDGQRGAVCRSARERGASHAAPGVMTELASVLLAFKAATGCDAAVWSRTASGTLAW